VSSIARNFSKLGIFLFIIIIIIIFYTVGISHKNQLPLSIDGRTVR
jgi:hypothetical protein